MTISLVSVLMTCITNTILLCIFCVFANKNGVLKIVGPECIVILMCLLIVRMFFPFEFKFAYNIKIEDSLQPLIRIFRYQIYGKIMIQNILLFIWIAGIFIKVFLYIMAVRKTSLFKNHIIKEEWDFILDKYKLETSDYKGLDKVQAGYCDFLSSPCVMGIKKPCILFPRVEYSRKQFHYILKHELMHVQNRDVLWNILIEMLSIVFWWNPLLSYIKSQMLQLVEIRNDSRIMKEMDEKETVFYMQALVDTVKNTKKSEIVCSVSFNNNGMKALKKRLKFIANGTQITHMAQIGLVVLTGLILVVNVSFNLMPYSTEYAGEGIPVMEDNTYLITNGEKYDVYLFDQYIETVDDVMGYDGIPVYDNLEEVKK